jgi:hypothetical protein
MTKYDKQFAQTVKDVQAGIIQEIHVEDTDTKAGGALSKSVPKPK